jgi:hypothetical protein
VLNLLLLLIVTEVLSSSATASNTSELPEIAHTSVLGQSGGSWSFIQACSLSSIPSVHYGEQTAAYGR